VSYNGDQPFLEGERTTSLLYMNIIIIIINNRFYCAIYKKNALQLSTVKQKAKSLKKE